MKKALVAVASVLTVYLVVMIGRAIFEQNLRARLAQSVVYVTNDAGNSGGTGFQLENDKGRKFIVTNSHVCEAAGLDGIISIRSEHEEPSIKRRIIEASKTIDVCLIEAVDDMPALKMADGYEFGDVAHVLGHPYLQPRTFVSGELVGEEQVAIVKYILTPETEKDVCPGTIEDVQMFIFEMKACVIRYKSISTTITIFGGNSGSPLVNAFGEVIGVVFAANNVDHWGKAVPLEELQEFINRY